MYVQHAPVPVQASFESPAIVASMINQLRNGGNDFIIVKIINKVSIAFKLFVFIFLLIISRFLIPECSTLIKLRPTKPIIKGKTKLKKPGKKEVTFIKKNEFKKTSKIDKKIKNNHSNNYLSKEQLGSFHIGGILTKDIVSTGDICFRYIFFSEVEMVMINL